MILHKIFQAVYVLCVMSSNRYKTRCINSVDPSYYLILRSPKITISVWDSMANLSLLLNTYVIVLCYAVCVWIAFPRRGQTSVLPHFAEFRLINNAYDCTSEVRTGLRRVTWRRSNVKLCWKQLSIFGR
jgi:hypothetical protein